MPTLLEHAEQFLLEAELSPNGLLTYDIETPMSAYADEDELDEESVTITQIQFSLHPYSGIAFPWREPFITIARKLLVLSIRKAGWNIWNFDDPRLKLNGLVINGVSEDAMWLWHHLQPDLPMGLQFATGFFGMDFPWKHLTANLPRYGCVDVDAVQRFLPSATEALKQLGIYRGYYEHVVRLFPILRRAAERGMPVNGEKLTAFAEKITLAQEEVKTKKLMPAVADLNLGKIQPKDGYKGVPPALKPLIEAGMQDLPQFDNDGDSYTYAHLPFKSCPTPDLEVVTYRWCRKYEFNPNSSKQVLEYMRVKKHPIPKEFKTNKDTTSKEELVRLAKKVKDPFYTDLLEFRQYDKFRTTYCKGWKPDADGRVHTTWTFQPATGQLSSRDPNVQNFPKHAELAKELRDCVEAPEGYVLAEFDYKSFHALTLGFEAKDQDYMRLARLDIHSYVAAHLLKLPSRNNLLAMNDLALSAALKWIKHEHPVVRDKKAKPSILGYGFGLGAAHLYDMNRESFSNVREAKELLQLLDSLFPKTAAFREEIKHKAQKDLRLVSRHGYHRRFHDVLEYWGTGKLEDAARKGHRIPSVCPICRGRHDNGEEAEAAIAFLPANDAFGHIKDVMLRLEDRRIMEEAGFINTIHDSLVFLIPENSLDNLIPIIYQEMTKASTILVDPEVAPNGLVCDVEVKAGKTWNTMTVVDVQTQQGVLS